jgi:hypothetical protein
MLKNGNHSYIANVYYILSIKHNMLSVGQLIEKDYTLFMKDCNLTFKDYNEKLISFMKMSKNMMFSLNIYMMQQCI